MIGGGSRRSIAVTLLFSAALLIPGAVRASTPVTLLLSVNSATGYTNQPFNLFVDTSPAVPGVSITYTDTTSSFVLSATTNAQGTALLSLTAGQFGIHGVDHIFATWAGNGTYGPATSNTVDVNFIFLTQVTLTYGSSVANPDFSSQVYTVDELAIHVRLQVAACDGTIHVVGQTNGFNVTDPAGLVNTPEGQSCGLDLNLGQQAVSDFPYRAVYDGSAENSSTFTADTYVNVTKIVASTVLTSPVPQVPPGTIIPLRVTVSAPHDNSYILGQGTIAFFDGSTQLGSAPAQNVGGVNSATLPASFSALGVHSLHATWSGTADANPSTSDPVSLNVADVGAPGTGFGLGASTFYPIVDGYRDVLAINGTLNEPATVTILIRQASTNALVGQLYLPRGGAGGYSVSWNGRRSAPPTGRHGAPTSGAIVPAGTYRITQVVTDGLGVRVSATNTVTVSWQRLYWYTGSKTLYGNQYTVKGNNGGIGITSASSYYRGERLYDPGSTPGYWAALGYQFTLPSATVYSSISFSVLGSGTSSPYIGLQNRQLGTWPAGSPWIINDFSPIVGVTTRYQWSTVVGDPTYNRIGTTVRGMVLAIDWTSGRYDVSQVKLSYRYALLK